MRCCVRLGAICLGALLSACGTTYTLPDIDEATNERAARLFAEAQSEPVNRLATDREAVLRFRRVAPKIKTVAENFCRREMADEPDFNCDVEIGVDTKMKHPNAYFTFSGAQNTAPIIRVTGSMLKQIENDHELAFILGHEYGHLIGRHIEKKQQQALAGALILGVISAAAIADNPYADSSIVSDNMELGMQIGGSAFSQEYELESDTVGVIIAHSAGYDPAIGARFFARAKPSRTAEGTLSFWGTHPPDENRVATVLATMQQLETLGGITRRAR